MSRVRVAVEIETGTITTVTREVVIELTRPGTPTDGLIATAFKAAHEAITFVTP